MKPATNDGMLVAVPNCRGRVSPVFDVAARLLLVAFPDGGNSHRREIVMFAETVEGIVRNLRELSIETVICGAVSAALREAIENVGIQVVSPVCGEIESVLDAYRAGRLLEPEFIMPGCCALRWSPARGARSKQRRCGHRSRNERQRI